LGWLRINRYGHHLGRIFQFEAFDNLHVSPQLLPGVGILI
jgi:hypothetical protein